jgi:hypothetical protein
MYISVYNIYIHTLFLNIYIYMLSTIHGDTSGQSGEEFRCITGRVTNLVDSPKLPMQLPLASRDFTKAPRLCHGTSTATKGTTSVDRF